MDTAVHLESGFDTSFANRRHQPSQPQSEQKGDRSTDPPPRVLIVEDEFAIASGLRMLLEGEGCVVDLAPDIRRATDMLLREPQWVILDVMLPDGEGTAVLELIRQKQLDCRVIVTTGIADSEARNRIMALNPTSYMEKPVEINALFNLLGLQ